MTENKPSTRKFYRRVFMVEILSKEPIPEDASLDTLHYETTNGPCSGIVKAHGETVVDGPTMAKLLAAQLSDPGFFGLTSDGCDSEPIFIDE